MLANFRITSALGAALIASAMVNVLVMTGPLYLLNVYDKVFASGAIETLLALSLIAACAYGALLRAEDLRIRILHSAPPIGGRLAALPSAPQLLDLPFLPLFLGVLWLIHPVIALTALGLGLFDFLFAWRRPLAPTRQAAVMRGLHQIGQSAVIGVGAALALQGTLSMGALFAAALLAGKLYAPLEALAAVLRGPEAAQPFAGNRLICEGYAPGPHPPLNFSIPGGEALAIIGASGSGKTRLLQHLIARGPGVTLPLPTAPQPALAALPQALPPSSLPGGRARLLAIEQIFATGARSILLDLPENDLDSYAIDRLCDLIGEARDRGASLVIATHHNRLISLCNHVLLLDAQPLRAAS